MSFWTCGTHLGLFQVIDNNKAGYFHIGVSRLFTVILAVRLALARRQLFLLIMNDYQNEAG